MTHTITHEATVSLSEFRRLIGDEIYMDELIDSLMAATVDEWCDRIGLSVDDLRVGPSSAWPIRPWPVYVRGHLIGEINTTHSSPRLTVLPRQLRHADLLDLP